MTETEQMKKRVRAALERCHEINLHASHVRLDMQDGLLVLSGEVEDIAAKCSARQTAVGLIGSERLKDRLQVKPTQRFGDGAIAAALLNAFAQEKALRDYHKRVETGNDSLRSERTDVAHTGSVEAHVRNASILLEGVVQSLMLKRLIEVIAWWIPGVSNVDNRLHVSPDETDSDDEVADAVRMVMEHDPWLDAGQIDLRVRQRVVTLKGLVSGEEQRRMAAQDAWYVLGVHGVENRLHTRVPERR